MTGTPAPDPVRRGGAAHALARTARPRQWIKNLLVFTAPGAAGSLSHLHPALEAAGAFGIFCLTASGTYFLNDALDREADAMHPRKRHRPVAAGEISAGAAVWTGIGLMVAGAILAWALAGWQLSLTMVVYVAVNIAYSTWLKNEPVVDIIAVASGFVLRAIAGGVATHVPLSDWFLIVASFGSLFIVAGKRHAEHLDLGEERAEHRSTLATYSLTYLRYVRAVSSGVTLTAYCLWAFEKATAHYQSHSSVFFRLSIVPIAFGILRYALLLDGGAGGAPEEIVLSDRRLQLAGVLWAICFALGIYGP